MRRSKLMWSKNGRSILSDDQIKIIRECLERGPILVEHWLYHGASAPKRLIFDGFEDFEVYVHQWSRPGDVVHVWDYDKCFRDDNMIASGKYSDDDVYPHSGGSF